MRRCAQGQALRLSEHLHPQDEHSHSPEHVLHSALLLGLRTAMDGHPTLVGTLVVTLAVAAR